MNLQGAGGLYGRLALLTSLVMIVLGGQFILKEEDQQNCGKSFSHRALMFERVRDRAAV